jgi:hypothetical protein
MERRTLRAGSDTPEVVRRFSFHFDETDIDTTHPETGDLLQLATLLFPGNAVRTKVEDWRQRPGDLGKSTLRLSVAFSEPVLRQVLRTNESAFTLAYGRACLKGYHWTEDRLRVVRTFRRAPPVSFHKHTAVETPRERQQRLERLDLDAACRSYRVMTDRLRSAKTDFDETRAASELAQIDGFDLRTLLALALLSGERVAREMEFSSQEGFAFRFQSGS